jgi:phospholipid-binding lipoprotein MlaA
VRVRSDRAGGIERARRPVAGRHALGGIVGTLFLLVGLSVGGCGSVSGGLHADTQALLSATVVAPAPADTARDAAVIELAVAPGNPETIVEGSAPAPPEDVVMVTGAPIVGAAGATEGDVELLPMESITDAEMTPYLLALAETMTLAQASREGGPPLEPPLEEYDPWESWNETMFRFNYNLDKYVLKPIAKGYNFFVPDELQRMIDRGFQNISFVPRFVNNLLQAKWAGAGREMARFLINSTIGIGGLWDMARQEWGIEPSKEDFGQTLGVWGVGPGPFLIVPVLPPMTVRDGIGFAVDSAMDPLSYFIPFIWQRLVMKIVNIVNDRSLNLEVFEGVEETTVDLYTAVRNAYLQRRERQIRE